jgi:hypothetical protein
MSRWGDARGNFRDLTALSEEATRFIREHHPLFAQTLGHVTTKSSLVSNVSTEALNDREGDSAPVRRGRPRKINQFYADSISEPSFLTKKTVIEEPEVVNDDGQRRKRNVGIPRHFENMVMIEHKKRRFEQRDRDEEDNVSTQAYDATSEQPKRRRGRPAKTREEEMEAQANQPLLSSERGRSAAPRQSIITTAEEVAPAVKRLTFPEFCDQLRDFFRVLGAWYGVSAPVILHYLREQILVSLVAHERLSCTHVYWRCTFWKVVMFILL